MKRNTFFFAILALGTVAACAFDMENAGPVQISGAVEPAEQPVTPAPSAAALHFVYASSPSHSDSIRALAQSQPHIAFVSALRPADVPSSQWAAYLSYRSEPQPTADDIASLLSLPSDEAPRLVMIEELHNNESEVFIAALADEMNEVYPEWRGRWGAFVSFGHYARLATAIDALLRADALIALELYPRQSEYCASGANGGQRDRWLARQFVGDARVARLSWLMSRRAMHDSESVITPLFGVGDVLMDGAAPAKFLDRMFYVWVTRTGHASLIDASRGGPGAYKWQDIDQTPLGYGVSNTSRDLAFVQSFEHYSIAHKTTSLKGPVPCDD